MRAIQLALTAGIVAAILFLSSVCYAQYQITSCPYTANVANAVYTVVGTVWVKGGDCIDVTAPGITILLNGATVNAPMAIKIHRAATRAHILGPGHVSQIILDEGDSAAIEDLTIGGNGNGSALVLRGVSDGAVRANIVSGDPAIWLDNTKKSVVDHNKAGAGYGSIGVLVTNSDAKTTQSKNNIISNNNVSGDGIGILVDGVGPTCKQQVPSLGNLISGNTASDDIGMDSPGVGVWLGCGARHTIVTHNVALHNWNYDAFDGNVDCRANTWKDNKFKNVYPSCILGLPPKEKPLYAFQGLGDGANPTSGLVFDSAGNLYGTTPLGGTGCAGQGCGIVFMLSRFDKGWTKTTIYQFTGTNGDGSAPSSGLILDQAGNLYGETSFGGSAGTGTVFELSPASNGTWAESVLYNFTRGVAGGYPYGGLIFDQARNLYGVAGGGLGDPNECGGSSGCGLVFELSPQTKGRWSERVLYRFRPKGGDGIGPNAVTFDALGNLYGTTYVGGANGEGTVFELTPGQNGIWSETVIHSFANDKNGRAPLGGVVLDKADNIFGTTWRAGSSDAGTVFELSPAAGGSWTFTLLHTFTDRLGGPDVGFSVAAPILDAAGNLYGTEEGPGPNTPSVGSVFKLTPRTGGRWKETVLYHFGGGPDGGFPADSLVLDQNGNLFGTSYMGGVSGCVGGGGCGVVFEVKKQK